jgi:hypothetical protein
LENRGIYPLLWKAPWKRSFYLKMWELNLDCYSQFCLILENVRQVIVLTQIKFSLILTNLTTWWQYIYSDKEFFYMHIPSVADVIRSLSNGLDNSLMFPFTFIYDFLMYIFEWRLTGKESCMLHSFLFS